MKLMKVLALFIEYRKIFRKVLLLRVVTFGSCVVVSKYISEDGRIYLSYVQS